MSTIIDFHSHVLPGIDDGSSSLDESVAMLYMAQAQGISQVIATPHFYANCDDLDYIPGGDLSVCEFAPAFFRF